MTKCFAILILILLMTGCTKETNQINELPKNNAISQENNLKPSPSLIPSPSLSSPTPSVDNPVEISPVPTDVTEKDLPVKSKITTPILVKGLFLGGLSDGLWMQPDEFYQEGMVELENFTYDTYKDGANTGTAVGGLPLSWMTGEPIKEEQYNQEFCITELFDIEKQKVEYDIALQADWNLFPRTYQLQSTQQTYYMNLLIDHLKSYGLENPETTIKQLIKVDIEGDGTDEVLIAADNTVDGQFEEVKKGDNAVLIFRKLVDGEVMNQVIEQDIRVKEEEYPSLYRILSQVEQIADLDGDQELEVIIKSWYYEGTYWSIYKLIDNRLELVASTGYGA